MKPRGPTRGYEVIHTHSRSDNSLVDVATNKSEGSDRGIQYAIETAPTEVVRAEIML